MPNYLILAQFTDQGLRNMSSLVSRMRTNLQTAQGSGVRVTPYVTLGEYDQVLLLEAADDEMALRAVLNLVGQGNVRTRTLRAFTLDELEQLLSPSGPSALDPSGG